MKRLLFLILCGIAFSCSTFVSNIPYARVYLELDLTFSDRALKAMSAYKIYNQKNIDQAGEMTGFGGVLVYHGVNASGMDQYYAFDAACPYEAKTSIIVEITDDGLYAICPKCGSKYDLLNGIANPLEGPSDQYLKQYNVSMQGDKIYVTN